jgi:hypothetical protein
MSSSRLSVHAAVVLAALVAASAAGCGKVEDDPSDPADAGPDAAPPADAAPDATPAPGVMTLHVLGRDQLPRATATAVFTHADGTFVAAVTADATGTIRQLVDYGDTVHIGWRDTSPNPDPNLPPLINSQDLVTILRLEPGEEIDVNKIVPPRGEFTVAGNVNIARPGGVAPVSATQFQVQAGCRTFFFDAAVPTVLAELYSHCLVDGKFSLVARALDGNGALVAFSVAKDVVFAEGMTVSMPDWQSPPKTSAITVKPMLGSTSVNVEAYTTIGKRQYENMFTSIAPADPKVDPFTTSFVYAPGYATGFEISLNSRPPADTENVEGEYVLFARGPFASGLTVDFAETLPRIAEANYANGAFRWRMTGTDAQLARLDDADCLGLLASWSVTTPTSSYGATWMVLSPPDDVQSPLTFALFDLDGYQPPAGTVPSGYLDLYEAGLGYHGFKEEIGTNPFAYNLESIVRFDEKRFERSTAYFNSTVVQP